MMEFGSCRKSRRAGQSRNGLVVVALVAAAAGLSSCARADGSVPGAVITGTVAENAMNSMVPDRMTLSDDLDFYTGRLETRGDDDVLALQGVIRASQLRFSAYGRAEDLDRAETTLATLASQKEANASILSTEASIKMARHDFPGALEAARGAIEAAGVSGRDLGLYMRLFDALLAVGDYEEAAGLMDLHFDREKMAYVLRKVRLDDRMGRTEQALAGMEQALAMAEAYAEPRAFRAWAHTEVGHFNHHTGNPRAAVGHYVAALDLTPGAPAPLAALGWLAFTVDRNPDLARQLIGYAVDNGGELDLYQRLREISLWEGDHQSAENYAREFEHRARVDDPELRLYRRPLAQIFADVPGRASEAVALAKTDLDERPTSESWDTYAWALFRDGKREAACGASERSLEGVSPEPVVLFHAGTILQACGERDRARGLLEEALTAVGELGPRVADQIHLLLDPA